MGLSDAIRIALGRLTPQERAERDQAAQLRQQEQQQQWQARQDEQRQRQRKQQQAQEEMRRGEQDAQRHKQRLEVAAGISVLSLVCHPDTWRFVKEWTAKRRYNTSPDGWTERGTERVKPGPGELVTVSLSGPQVAEVLAGMCFASNADARNAIGIHTVKYGGADDATRATAARIYRALATGVDQVDPQSPGTQPLPPVVLDDRAGGQPDTAPQAGA